MTFNCGQIIRLTTVLTRKAGALNFRVFILIHSINSSLNICELLTRKYYLLAWTIRTQWSWQHCLHTPNRQLHTLSHRLPLEVQLRKSSLCVWCATIRWWCLFLWRPHRYQQQQTKIQITMGDTTRYRAYEAIYTARNECMSICSA